MNLYDALSVDNQIKFVNLPNDKVKEILTQNDNYLSLSLIEVTKVFYYFYPFAKGFDLDGYIRLFELKQRKPVLK